MIRLRIDGRETSVKEGTYILQAAGGLGIEIPTMCYLESMEPFATCMMCMVKDRDGGRLIPACSVRAEEGMDLVTDDNEVREARKTALELLLSDHVGDCEAPCQLSCPAHMNIPLMNRLLAAGKTDAALAVIKRDIALPSVLGRICPAPCEGACRRKPIDQAVSICMLKRHAGDFGSLPAPAFPAFDKSISSKRVAVIGSGPAGLSTAYYLQLRGISCEIFEKAEKPGGALRYGVPEEDLPRDVLEDEIRSIQDTGVAIHCGHAVDKKAFAGIRNAFDAVVIATGDFQDDQRDWGCGFTEKGITADRKAYTTSLEGVFAAGNIIRSSKMAVRAAGQGKEAAFAVHQWLAGQEILGEPEIFNSRFGRLMREEYSAYLVESVTDNRHDPSSGPGAGYTADEVTKEAARCMHCDCRKLDDCRLRDYSHEYLASQKHYRGSGRKTITKSLQHDLVVYESQKCIKCSICVRLTEKQREKIGMTFIGRGFDVEIGAPLNEELGAALTVTAAEAARACPTGALAMKRSHDEL
jgi:NADPH-dependent glutamate synthase beta subunit-like oxidoreductase